MREITYTVPHTDDVITLDPNPVPEGEDTTSWEVLVDGTWSSRVVLGQVQLSSDGTYYVQGGDDDAVEIDQLPAHRLEDGVFELYYAAFGVPIDDGDRVAVITTDEDVNSEEFSQRRTAVRVPADTDDLYRSDNEVLGYVLLSERGLFYGEDAETGAVTHGYDSPYLAGHAIINELGA